MQLVKKFIKKYFENFTYFYRHLGNKLFIAVTLNLAVGVLDGFGLAMFMPLLQIADDPAAPVSADELGKVGFIVKGLNSIGLELNFLVIICVIAVFFVLKGLATYFKGWYQVVLQQHFIKKIRIIVIRDFKLLSYKYFITSDVGRIQNTLTGEVDRVARSYQSYFQSMQQFIMVVVYMTFAFFIDYKFAILVSVGGLLSNFAYKQIYKNTKGASRNLTAGLHNYQGLIIQAAANFKYLKASGQLSRYSDKMEGQIESIEATTRKIGVLGAILNATREPLTILVVCVVIFVQVSVIGSSLSTILISLLFFYRALNCLMMMQTAWNTFISLSGSLENMSKFSTELRKNREVIGKEKVETFENSLTLKNAVFKYGESTILKDINLTVNKNESIAFVGESGSGKTTIVNIFSGLLPLDSGNFSIDGRDASSININSFQSRIGYITQDPVIFNDTIFNNVTFWAEPTPENLRKFREATDKAAITEYIDKLPQKEKTELGNNGINLSGGQKQRISIARELYKDIDILILDEATSALDSDTEKTIQENIDALKGKYTILIVAHRLSTIRNADRIVVMNAGEIIESGTFKELVERTPYFKKMVELQELT